MSLPDITHRQFLVLSLLMHGEVSGRVLRQKIAEHGTQKTTPAFYQLMSRLEDANLVTGRYVDKTIDGERIRERRYRITRLGERARTTAREFYAHPIPLQPGWANG